VAAPPGLLLLAALQLVLGTQHQVLQHRSHP
jgi:hypothetical protein